MKSWHQGSVLFAILSTMAATLLITVLFLTLRSGEKHIRYELTHRFAVGDPQFVRSMNHLLGPSLCAGNQIRTLHVEQVQVFEEDKRRSRRMTRAEFKNRSAVGILFDEFAGTLRRQL